MSVPAVIVGSSGLPGFGLTMRWLESSCEVDDLKENLRRAGLTVLSERLSDVARIVTKKSVVVVVEVVVTVTVVVTPAGTLSGSAGSLPWSISVRSKKPSSSRSTPTRRPGPGGTQL